jgi:hypothetical protein
MIRRNEAVAFAVEGLAASLYVTWLDLRRHQPDYLWLVVLIGIIISAGPAIILARRSPPPSWPDYERRLAAGVSVSGIIIAGWQIRQCAHRQGRRDGYALARRLERGSDANHAPPME